MNCERILIKSMVFIVQAFTFIVALLWVIKVFDGCRRKNAYNWFSNLCLDAKRSYAARVSAYAAMLSKTQNKAIWRMWLTRPGFQLTRDFFWICLDSCLHGLHENLLDSFFYNSAISKSRGETNLVGLLQDNTIIDWFFCF